MQVTLSLLQNHVVQRFYNSALLAKYSWSSQALPFLVRKKGKKKNLTAAIFEKMFGTIA